MRWGRCCLTAVGDDQSRAHLGGSPPDTPPSRAKVLTRALAAAGRGRQPSDWCRLGEGPGDSPGIRSSQPTKAPCHSPMGR